MSYPILRKNPIVDAILEINLAFQKDFNMAEGLSFYELIKNEFPIKEELIQFERNLNVTDSDFETNPKFERKSYGYAFSNKDRSKSIHIRYNAFSFSHLNGIYQTWEDFSKEAFNLFNMYLKNSETLIQPTKISLRFINQLLIPIKKIEEGSKLSDFVKTLPTIPPEMPNSVSNFFMKLSLKESDKTATIIQAINKPQKEIIPFIFDLSVKTAISDKENLKIGFDRLREFKNRIFFNSISSEMLNLLK
jgi:uncharacterized protein (TIGR04255 family)